MINLEKLKKQLLVIGVEASDSQLKKIDEFSEMVILKNKKMNLTAITDEKGFREKHIIDSLLAQSEIQKEKPKMVLDIGTGAGFPGIPLKIINPNIQFVLVDSLKKRVEFLKDVIEKLDLKNIEVINGRFEDLGQDENYRENFDIVISRAVAELPTLVEYMMPFAKIGGEGIAYKSKNAESEIVNSKKAMEICGCNSVSIIKKIIPDTELTRNLLLISKSKKTPSKYPRRNGIPSKKPLS